MNPAPSNPAHARAGILERISAAARQAGRDPDEITVVAVTKGRAWAEIEPLLAAGHKVFGENRVAEASERWRERPEGLELRFIGPLQTNKAGEAMRLFDVIESLDRPRLAAALAREIQRLGRSPSLYVQVNTGAEPQKGGVSPGEADAFIASCRGDHGLKIDGLMCIPPEGEAAAPHFAFLARLARRNGVRGLSMGMSADFEAAVRLGATSVRIGAALFGTRVKDPERPTRMA